MLAIVAAVIVLFVMPGILHDTISDEETIVQAVDDYWYKNEDGSWKADFFDFCVSTDNIAIDGSTATADVDYLTDSFNRRFVCTLEKNNGKWKVVQLDFWVDPASVPDLSDIEAHEDAIEDALRSHYDLPEYGGGTGKYISFEGNFYLLEGVYDYPDFYDSPEYYYSDPTWRVSVASVDNIAIDGREATADVTYRTGTGEEFIMNRHLEWDDSYDSPSASDLGSMLLAPVDPPSDKESVSEITIEFPTPSWHWKVLPYYPETTDSE